MPGKTALLLSILLAPAALPLLAQAPPVSAQVVAVDPLTHNVKRLRVRMPKPYQFEAGQFALITVPAAYVSEWNSKHKTNHESIQRPYSFASSPKRLPLAEFIIQLADPPAGQDVPPGIASTYVHTALKPGDTIEISQPMGSLNETGAPRPLILVAGGTGVAPFVGLLDHWFRAGQQRDRRIYLFFGARQRRDLLLDGQFRRWAAKHLNFTYVPVLSEPSPEDDWTGATGLVTAIVDRHFPGTLDADVLIAGAPRMMEETTKVARSKGVPDRQIRHDPIKVAPQTRAR